MIDRRQGSKSWQCPLFDSLYNFARWLVHNSSDAEDLVQETYLKALRSFASFQPGTNFRAWMFRILRNAFLSSCSTLDRRMTVAMDSEEDSYIVRNFRHSRVAVDPAFQHRGMPGGNRATATHLS